jgi:hypothetical protein
MNLSDVCAEVRALAEFGMTLRVTDAPMFYRMRLGMITAALENIERVHRMSTKSEHLEEMIQLRLQSLTAPVILGFQRILQQFVPPEQWPDALAELRAVASMSVATQIIETRALTG